MTDFIYLIKELFSSLMIVISQIITILTGILFLKAKDILSIFSQKEDAQTLAKITSISSISYYIGILTIVYGVLRICDRFIFRGFF